MNVACAVPACDRPVVGQCPGYEGSCGRFYCHEHSKDGLCAVCTLKRQKDLIEQDYFQTANNIKEESTQRVALFAVFGLLGHLVYFFLFLFSLGRLDVEGLHPCVVVVALGLPLPALVVGVYKIRRDIGKGLAREMNETKPGFYEYYLAFSSEELRAHLTFVVGLAVGMAGATIAAAASSIAKDERSSSMGSEIDASVKRELERELRRRGIE